MGQTRNTKRAKSDGRRRTRKTFGQRIIEGLTEAVEALERGERLDDHFPTNTIEIPAPTQYGPDTVRALRSRMGVSQRVFAKLLGVSPELVEHWEQGRRTPHPMACRLLDQIDRDPKGFLSELVVSRTSGRKAG